MQTPARHTGRSPSPAGFTLLELVLVLLIVSVLATVALQMIEPQVDEARFETTRSMIRAVDGAIYAERPRGDGRLLISGFAADMGRLPRAFPELVDGTAVLTLRELWDGRMEVLADGTTQAMFPYSEVPATATQIANTTDSNGDDVVADSTVLLGMGWRGPYLALPAGADALRDGWGHDLVSFTAYVDTVTYPHLRGAGDTDVLAAGAAVLGVRSLGSDDIEDHIAGASAYDRDLPAIVPAGSGLSLNATALVGAVTGRVYVAKTHRLDPEQPIEADHMVVQLYFPDANQPGMIRVERAELSLNAAPHATHDVFDFHFSNGAGGNVAFPIGSRVIRAYYNQAADASGDFGDGTNDPPASLALKFDLHSTNNTVELTVN